MKSLVASIMLSGAIALFVPSAHAQYTGGSGDGYTSSRSDDILYEGTTPIVTGAELPDIVHNLTINNPAGVTLSKNITVNGKLSVLDGDFNLNGFVVTFGPNATLLETPGNIIIGGGGNITVTRTLNDLSAGQNVGNLGLEIKTFIPLGETTIARGNVPQQLTPSKTSSRRFFDVIPANDDSLDATVNFFYDDSELEGIPEADLALFISHDAVGQVSGESALAKGLVATAADTTPSWDFLGGTVDAGAKKIEKGGVGGFSRLTIARGFVFLAEKFVKLEGNTFSQGDIHSNGDIVFDKGEPGTHTGDLTAVNDIKIDTKNTVVGNAFAGGNVNLRGSASVTGTVSNNASVALLGLPKPSFTASGEDVTVPKKGALSLDPGSYDDVEVKKGATLYLRSGDYFMDELDTEEEAVISIDVTNGPVNINVVRDLDFDEEVRIVITPAGRSASNQVTFTTLQHKKVDIEEEAHLAGWIIAPYAEVHFDEDCRFQGAVVAKAISVEEDVVFVPHSFSGELPKPAAAGKNEEVTSDQSPVTSYELSQNYPNPFNPTTTISFQLPVAGEVNLSIYNMSGQLVKRLVAGEMSAGRHSIVWNATDQRGQRVASGVYLYVIKAAEFTAQRKLVLMK